MVKSDHPKERANGAHTACAPSALRGKAAFATSCNEATLTRGAGAYSVTATLVHMKTGHLFGSKGHLTQSGSKLQAPSLI